MIELSIWLTSAIATAFFLAGVVKGVTGMGLPTVAMGVLGALLSPITATNLLILPSLVTNVWQLLAGPAFRPLVLRLWPMMLAVGIGTILGTALLVGGDTALSTAMLGGALVVLEVDNLLLSALAILPSLAGMWAGQAIRRLVSPATFRRWFLIGLLFLGAELALRPLF